MNVHWVVFLQGLCCFFQNVQIEGQIPFLGSVTEVSSVTLQKDVSLLSPRLTGS